MNEVNWYNYTTSANSFAEEPERIGTVNQGLTIQLLEMPPFTVVRDDAPVVDDMVLEGK